MNDQEKTNLLYSYPGRDDGKKVRINIYPIYELNYNIMQKQMFEKVDLKATDEKDDAVDACGYLGVFHRSKKKQKTITEEHFIDTISKENRLKDIFFKIREIDRQKNGFVTELELDDIIKFVNKELEDCNISDFIKPFCCRENKILIDYKKFKQTL